MSAKVKLPNGHRFVKQDGYKRNNFHNWAIFSKDGYLLSLGGKTKIRARELFIKNETFKRLYSTT